LFQIGTKCSFCFYRKSTAGQCGNHTAFRLRFFTGPLTANLGTHNGQRPEQSAFRHISPRRNKSAPGEVFLWGHQADRRPAVKTLTNEASIEGRFRFAGKNLAYDRQEFDRTTAWAFNKK
jgi:hypothetical protein